VQGKTMGGNVFAGKTAPILKENIQPTLDAYFAELAIIFPKKSKIFNMTHFESLGSVGKKPISGDIDLGVAPIVLLDKNLSDDAIALWNIDPLLVADKFQQLKRRARTASDIQLRMKAFSISLVKYINTHAPTIHCDEKKVDGVTMFSLYSQKDVNGNDLDRGIQIDWMIGDLNWLRFSYYSAQYPDDSNAKGLHRTQLMLSAFQIANLAFSHGVGVKDKSTNKLIATAPDQALDLLNKRLNIDLDRRITEDYYKLKTYLEKHLTAEEYSNMLNIYFKILDSTRADIPDNLQEEWLAKRDQLQLTGKFLPEDSKLKVLL
jgi:hypothetical protein